jgi:uncharacterized protein with PIN domain
VGIFGKENAMISLNVRCYAELNDVLPNTLRYRTFVHRIGHPCTVAQLLRSLRLLPESVDLVLVNGVSADLGFPLQDGDRVSLYPVFESFDISTATRLRAVPLRLPRFIADVHLGKLANHLRMFGFDTAYTNDARDAELIRLAVDEQRTLLSKDRELLQNEALPRRYFVRATDPFLQVVEVFRRFDLFGSVRPFTRCIACNAQLVAVNKDHVLHRLPLKVQAAYTEFQMCERCDRVYWKGSHYERMREFMQRVMQRGVTIHWG